jgi:hypothetical protein
MSQCSLNVISRRRGPLVLGKKQRAIEYGCQKSSGCGAEELTAPPISLALLAEVTNQNPELCNCFCDSVHQKSYIVVLAVLLGSAGK